MSISVQLGEHIDEGPGNMSYFVFRGRLSRIQQDRMRKALTSHILQSSGGVSSDVSYWVPHVTHKARSSPGSPDISAVDMDDGLQ